MRQETRPAHAAAQRGGAGSEKLLGRRIDESGYAAPVDDDHRVGEGGQDHRWLGPHFRPQSIACRTGGTGDAAAAASGSPRGRSAARKRIGSARGPGRVVVSVDRGAELRRTRKPLRIPGDVLAGDARRPTAVP